MAGPNGVPSGEQGRTPDLNIANRGSITGKPAADGVAGVGVGDVDGGDVVVVVIGSIASSLVSPSSWQKLDLVVFSLTTVTNRRGGAPRGGGGGGGGGG